MTGSSRRVRLSEPNGSERDLRRLGSLRPTVLRKARVRDGQPIEGLGRKRVLSHDEASSGSAVDARMGTRERIEGVLSVMRLLTVVLLIAGIGTGCGSGNGTSAQTSVFSGSSELPHDTIRVAIADGCPPSLAGHADDTSTGAIWITNPDTADLGETFVPGAPSEALICRYAARDAVTVLPDGRTFQSGDVYSATHIDRDAAIALGASLNDITPSKIASNCVPMADKARYTAIVFAVPGRSDVDLWLKDWYQCPEVGNGTRTSGELANGLGSNFLHQLDVAAPPAPQQDFPSGQHSERAYRSTRATEADRMFVVAVPLRLSWVASRVSRRRAHDALAVLLGVDDLPGDGWRLIDERAWRTGVIQKTEPWAQRARRAGCLTAWRSFEQSAPQRWIWIQTAAVESDTDALAALEAAARSRLANLRAEFKMVSEVEVDPPAILGATKAWARETHSSGPRGEGIALLMACAVDSTVVALCCSGLVDSWRWSDVVALAERQALRPKGEPA